MQSFQFATVQQSYFESIMVAIWLWQNSSNCFNCHRNQLLMSQIVSQSRLPPQNHNVLCKSTPNRPSIVTNVLKWFKIHRTWSEFVVNHHNLPCTSPNCPSNIQNSSQFGPKSTKTASNCIVRSQIITIRLSSLQIVAAIISDRRNDANTPLHLWVDAKLVPSCA